MSTDEPRHFHLHLLSDATGETLSAIARAASVQYARIRPIEHVHPLIRSRRQLQAALNAVEASRGIVLYTIVNPELVAMLEEACRRLNVPCVAPLANVMSLFGSHLGAASTPTVAGQHALDADYFRRIEAVGFSMMYDDGRLPERIDDADVVILGVSRTSKTPTSIYLANKGYKTANLPLVTDLPLPPALEEPTSALIVGLVATPERIAQVRRNRLPDMGDFGLRNYVDLEHITAEIAYTRRLFARHRWPVIDVTRRSIEETAAEIIKLRRDQTEQTRT